MLKRLIEVALPLEAVSEESAADNRVRSGHIRTLHIWWARRPLAACRAVLFASLIPDPDDPECPESFRSLLKHLLAANEFKPRNADGSSTKDTPRNRCLEFIKHLVKWENSNNIHYIEPARQLVTAAHKILNPKAEGDASKVLDPFAGGGAIPLEALRLGCEAHAIDLNPVAHLIELCTLVYPQKYGQPNSRAVPNYIMRLIAHNKERNKTRNGSSLFDRDDPPATFVRADDELIPDVEITADEYRHNPLSVDVKYWGMWLFGKVRQSVERYYQLTNAKSVPLAYLWARTVKCPNPACGAVIPCIHQLWLCNKSRRKIALKMTSSSKKLTCSFEVVEGDSINFDPEQGTMQRGQAACPICQTIATSKYLQSEGNANRLHHRLLAVVETHPGTKGKHYRLPTKEEEASTRKAILAFEEIKSETKGQLIPDEPLKAWSGVFNAPLFGMNSWGSLFNPRQSLFFAEVVTHFRALKVQLASTLDKDYATAVSTYVAFAIDKCLDFGSTLCRWGNDDEGVTGTFGRQALPMVWDYAESNPLQQKTGGFSWAIDLVIDALDHLSELSDNPANVQNASASHLPFTDSYFDCITTDPPYYSAVPYSDLSDFFYVWLKRNFGDTYKSVFRSPLTPKSLEIVSHLGNNYPGQKKTAEDYEKGMFAAFSEMKRTLRDTGICSVMFAHKTTTAWENLINALVRAGFSVTTSWPIHTEGRGRLRAHNSAALAGSITLVCRPRATASSAGYWDDVRKELKEVAN